MNGLDIIILIIAIVIIAAVVGAFVTREQKSLKEMTKKYYVNDKLGEELKEEKFQPRKVTVQSATRQINEVVKEAVGVVEPKIKEEKQKKSEFPIDQPKKKRKYYPKKK
jgi:FtsZ-interacting cell division protein ZipA